MNKNQVVLKKGGSSVSDFTISSKDTNIGLTGTVVSNSIVRPTDLRILRILPSRIDTPSKHSLLSSFLHLLYTVCIAVLSVLFLVVIVAIVLYTPDLGSGFGGLSLLLGVLSFAEGDTSLNPPTEIPPIKKVSKRVRKSKDNIEDYF